MAIDYDPFSDAARINPYPFYKQLRDEAPVYWCKGTGAWVISRYEDARYVLTNTELFSSDAMATAVLGIPPGTDLAKDPYALKQLTEIAEALPFDGIGRGQGATLITADPPKHDEMRAIVNRGFSPRRIAAWQPRVAEIVDDLAQKLRSRSQFDVVADLAVPLPMTVIVEMLGVEHEHRDAFKRWSDGIIAGATGSGREHGVRGGGLAKSIGEMGKYLIGVAKQRSEDPREDLISLLVKQEEDGFLTPAELVLFGIVLLVAGNETTTNLIGSTVNQLLDHPDQLRRVVQDPGLIPNLVEEGLRTVGPVQFVFRRATGDVEIAGQRLPENSIVAVLLGSANRDERQFEDAERFDVTRDTSGHLSFGFGVHFCLGSSLARMEARLAFEALVPDLMQLERVGDPEYIDSYLMRGLRRLELRRRS